MVSCIPIVLGVSNVDLVLLVYYMFYVVHLSFLKFNVRVNIFLLIYIYKVNNLTSVLQAFGGLSIHFVFKSTILFSSYSYRTSLFLQFLFLYTCQNISNHSHYSYSGMLTVVFWRPLIYVFFYLTNLALYDLVCMHAHAESQTCMCDAHIFCHVHVFLPNS